jgi:hypothetical protein
MKAFLIFSFLLFSSSAFAQMQIKEYDASQAPSNSLSSSDIMLTNDFDDALEVECSEDKRTWKKALINPNHSIVVSISRNRGYLFVSLCQKNSIQSDINCENYQLAPQSRYGLKWSFDKEMLVIKRYTRTQ